MTTPPTPTPDVGPFFDARQLGVAYRATLPWMLLLWAIGVMLPGPQGWQLILGLGASPFFVAAAARALGYHPGWGLFPLAVDRAFSHLAALLVLVALSALAAAFGGTVGAAAADGLGLPDDRPLSIPAAALAVLPFLWGRWPAAVLAYAAPEAMGVRGPLGRAWRGPRFADARRITRAASSPRRTTLILAVLFLWIVLLVTLANGAPARRVMEGLSYLIFVPLLTAMALVEARRMVETVWPGAAPNATGSG